MGGKNSWVTDDGRVSFLIRRNLPRRTRAIATSYTNSPRSIHLSLATVALRLRAIHTRSQEAYAARVLGTSVVA